MQKRKPSKSSQKTTVHSNLIVIAAYVITVLAALALCDPDHRNFVLYSNQLVSLLIVLKHVFDGRQTPIGNETSGDEPAQKKPSPVG